MRQRRPTVAPRSGATGLVARAAPPCPRRQHNHELPDGQRREPSGGWRTVTLPLATNGVAARFALEQRYCPECLALVGVERSMLVEGGSSR